MSHDRFAWMGTLLVLLGTAGCGAPADDHAVATGEAALGASATITFDGSFRQSVAGVLAKGNTATVVYDASRLTACRGDQGGAPGWTITGFASIAGGPIHTFEAGGFSPSHGTAPAVIPLDRSGDLQIWFQNTSLWGCSAYDSAFGSNYHFTVAPADGEPGWMGNVRYAINRMTCDGGPCESTLAPFTSDIVYETYARQRAAIRVVEFDVWKEGVTDHDDPDLWKKLDVQVHARVAAGGGAFASRYVTFSRRVGNDARYAIDLRDLDSVPDRSTAPGCPAYPLTYVPGSGQAYVEAPVELYVTVNGAELRPASGGTFRIRYQNYAGAYAGCASP